MPTDHDHQPPRPVRPRGASRTKYEKLTVLHETGVILIVRLDDPDEAYQIARAAVDGGIRALEITLSVPGALGVISRLAHDYGTDVLIGAGTVLDGHSGYAAIAAGAEMLVSPQLNHEMLTVAHRYQAVSVSGAFTPTEILNTVEAGADMVKLFPAEFNGPAYVRTVMAPVAQAPIVPTGGVTASNVGEWFAAGAAAVGVGSYITHAADGTRGYAAVTGAAERLMVAVAAARST